MTSFLKLNQNIKLIYFLKSIFHKKKSDFYDMALVKK